MTSLIAAGGSGRSTSVIPAIPAASSVTTIAFIRDLSHALGTPLRRTYRSRKRHPREVGSNFAALRRPLAPVALAVAAARPAAGPALAFLELFLGPADAALAGLVLLG